MKNDENNGVYRKYEIKRTDGSSEPGGKHEHCRYFALDLEHDPFAVPALRAYAEACRETHPELAHDLDYVCAGTPDEDGQTISNSSSTRLDLKMHMAEKRDPQN